MPSRRTFLHFASSALAGAGLTALAGAGLTACGGGLGATETNNVGRGSGGPLIAAGRPDSEVFATAINRFALDFWGQLASGNQVFSPASIEIALAMTYAGARGQTATQMATALSFGDDPATLHASASEALGGWNQPDREAYRLAIANRLFGEQTYAWQAPFMELTRDLYRAPLEPMDFRGSPGPARERINEWVEERTEDKIRDLLPDGSITGDTRLVLTNAVYFLAKWAAPFEANETYDARFDAPQGAVQVPTMHQQERFRHFRGDGVQVLEMPYRGGEIGMTIVLPEQRGGLAAVEAELDVERLGGWLEDLEPTLVSVALPKFRLAPDAMSLSSHLSALGMVDAFTPNADLSAMADPAANEGLPLLVSDVFHKAFVEVDEEGTEAAAATAVVVAIESAAIVDPTAVVPFIADHPFLFFLRDLETGAVLFMGRVTDPS